MKSDSTKTLNILVVEDESVSIALLHTLLGKSSLPVAKIEFAKSLKDALELLNNNHFDVALMDLNLPDSRGLDTLVSVSEKYPRMAIVVITGEYDEDFGLKVIAMGAQEYLVKGMYDKFALIKSIHYALERKKAENEMLMAEEKYRTIFENSAVAITVTDEQERLISWNKFTEDLLGMEKEDLYLKPVKSLYPVSEWERIRHCNIRKTEQQQRLEESRMIKKNGQVIDVDISLNVLKSSDGEVTGYVGVFSDVTERKRHKEILDRKQKNLEAIFDAAPVAMLLLDENTIVKRVNDAVRQMVNKEYSQIIGRHLGDILGCVNSLSNEHGCRCGPTCSTCPVRKTIKRVLDSQQSVHEIEFRPTLKVDNKEVNPWLSISAEPVIIDGSSCIVIAVDDITERKLAERELRRSEEKLRDIFENTAVGMYRTTPDGRVLMANLALVRMLGYSSFEELAERNLEVEGYEPKYLRSEFRQRIEREGRVISLESAWLRRDGTILSIIENARAVRDETGNTLYYEGTAEDITERKKAAEALRTSEERLRLALSAAQMGTWRWDPVTNQDTRGANLNRILGLEAVESTQPVEDFIQRVHPEERDMVDEEVHRAICERRTYVAEFRVIRPDGSVRWLRNQGKPLCDENDHVLCLTGAVVDITERKLAEEKLRETMELKSQFISTVSHELRTPLACVKEAIAVVLDGAAGKVKDKQRNFLDIAARNIDRLAMLINDVLDFQRLEAGRMNFNIRQNDINRVVEEVHRTMLSYARKKKVEFSLELDGKLPKAEFDSDRIFQVLTNLVGNAIKFTPEQGRVSVSTKCQAEELVIRVSDTGMGIPKQSIPKIFDRFYRVQRPGKEIQGTGLGLAIVKRIVVRHGGRIELKSELDQGTTFTFFLPLKTETQQATLLPEMDKALESALSIQTCGLEVAPRTII